VNDLRLRQDEMIALIKSSRDKIRKNEIYIQSFKNTVYNIVQEIADIDIVREKVNKELQAYV
jgi:hypothetical protein